MLIQHRERHRRVVSMGVGFLPTKLADLAVWLRADTGITTSGGAVSQWDFKNGIFRGVSNVAQGAGANQPAHIVSDVDYNGQSTISFDGNDWLDTIAFSSQLSQPNTIFFVGNTGTVGTREFMMSGVDLDVSGDVNEMQSVASTWRIRAGVNLTGGAEDTNPHVFEATFNGGSSSLLIDGVSIASGNAGAQPMKDIKIGARSIFNDFNFLGRVAEIIVYNRNLTDAEDLQVREYLQSRYQTPSL